MKYDYKSIYGEMYKFHTRGQRDFFDKKVNCRVENFLRVQKYTYGAIEYTPDVIKIADHLWEQLNNDKAKKL